MGEVDFVSTTMRRPGLRSTTLMMLSTCRYASFRSRELDENTTLFIGADTTVRLLKVVVAKLDTNRARIMYAMALRAWFCRFLKGK